MEERMKEIQAYETESKARMKEIEELGISCAGLLVDTYEQLDRMQSWQK